MGASFTNYHARTADTAKCSAILSKLVRTRALLTKSKDNWITIYDETSEEQDMAEMQRMAKALSKDLATDVLAFLLHDSDVFIYETYSKGKLVDRFNGSPDYFEEVSAVEQKKWAGNFSKLLPLAPKGISAKKIEQTLKEKSVFQEERIAAFAKLMGIDPVRACTGFRYLQQEGHKLQLIHGKGHSSNDTTLVESIEKGDLEKVRELLAAGASPNQKSRLGESLLTTAIRFHRKEIAFALLDAGASPHYLPETNAIWAAVAHGESEVLARILQTPLDQLRPDLPAALMAAVQDGRVEIVRTLLKTGADPNRSSGYAMTPLMMACLRGMQGLLQMVKGIVLTPRPEQKETDWLEIVKALLQAGADVNAKEKNGLTALMIANNAGHAEIVQELLKAGADPKLKP